MTLSFTKLKDAIFELLDEKQDVLIEGANITIVDNVISATGGGGGGASVTGETLLLSSATVVDEELIL